MLRPAGVKGTSQLSRARFSRIIDGTVSINGIYIDEMANWEFSSAQVYLPSFYADITHYSKSLGMVRVIGNSGADVPYYFIRSVDIIGGIRECVHPSARLAGGYMIDMRGWHSGYNRSNFWWVGYNVSSFNPYYLLAASNYAGYLFLTDGTRPQPYGVLPAYFDELVSRLASIVPLTIHSAGMNGTMVDDGFGSP
jgi:hypothetical protein